MVSITHNNHFKFGYNGSHFNPRASDADVWCTSYGTVEKEVWSFRDECRRTASIIADSTNRPIYVGLSGGMDSEVVASSFIAQGIPFIPVIAVYDGGVNQYDTDIAVSWCKYRNLTPIYLDIQVTGYWKTKEAIDLAISLGCISPQFLVYMNIIQQIHDMGGFPVFGSAECYLENNSLPSHMFEREKVASLYRYCLVNEIPSAIGFFQYTPDIMLSYLSDPIVQWKVNESAFSSSKEFKYEFYRRHFDINPRKSTSGFEPIWQKDKILRDRLLAHMPASDSVNKHDYYQLITALKGTND